MGTDSSDKVGDGSVATLQGGLIETMLSDEWRAGHRLADGDVLLSSLASVTLWS